MDTLYKINTHTTEPTLDPSNIGIEVRITAWGWNVRKQDVGTTGTITKINRTRVRLTTRHGDHIDARPSQLRVIGNPPIGTPLRDVVTGEPVEVAAPTHDYTQTLVAINYSEAGDIDRLLADLEGVVIEHTTDIYHHHVTGAPMDRHHIRFDRRNIRNTDAHAYGCRAGFVCHIEY